MNSKQNIRLNEKYIEKIKYLALVYFNSTDVRIFGSRADINKRGGDIDIYIKTSNSTGIVKSKLAFLRDFQKYFGNQKIDLVIEYRGSKSKKIYTEAKREGILI